MGRYELPPFSLLQAAKRIVVPVAQSREPDEQGAAYYASRTDQFRHSPGSADIVMLGDSITEFGPWQAMFPNIGVLNRGIGSDTTRGVIERLPEVMTRKPRAVFVMIGVNDLRAGSQPEAVIGRIQQIATSLRTSGIAPVLQSILYTADQAVNRSIRAVNVSIETWCSSNGCVYVDVNRALAPGGTLLSKYTWDGLHLNGDGYAAWKDLIEPAFP